MASENGDLRLLEPSSYCFMSEPLPPDVYPTEQLALMTEFQNFVEPVCQALQMSFSSTNCFEPLNGFEEVVEEEEEEGIWNDGIEDDVMWSIARDQSALEASESYPGTLIFHLTKMLQFLSSSFVMIK